MVKVATYFALTLGAFVFWQSMDKVHVWIALHQDEKVKNSSFSSSQFLFRIGLRMWVILNLYLGFQFNFSSRSSNIEMGHN